MRDHLLIAQPPIQVMPALAEVLGFNEAAVIQVTHFWLSPLVNPDFKDGCRWVQNLAFHLQGRFPFWDGDAIGYIVAQLEQSGILISRHEVNSDGVPLSWHTIHYGRLESLSPVPALSRRASLSEAEGPGPENLAPDIPFTPDSPIEKANSNMRPPFRAAIHTKGDTLYVMAVEDMRHFLSCELTLEVQGNGQEGEPCPKEVVCHFPRIPDGEFRQFVWDDPTLYRILMDRFHMKTMKQLLLFCTTHHARKLILFSDDPKEADFEIYREFLGHIGQAPTPKGEGTGLVVPADRETFDAWIAFMEKTAIRLQQTLWRERKGNPALRHYLQQQDWLG